MTDNNTATSHASGVAQLRSPQSRLHRFTPKILTHAIKNFHFNYKVVLKVLAVMLLCGSVGLNSYTITSYFLTPKQSVTVATPSVQITAQNSDYVPTQENTTDQTSPQATPSIAAPTSKPAATNPIKTNPQPVAPKPVYCGVSSLPEGACTAITSIEKDGVKNNKYVSANTDNLPAGTTVDVDQTSWFQGGPEIGSTKFTAKFAGKTYSGTMFWQVNNGVWKVISYTINQ